MTRENETLRENLDNELEQLRYDTVLSPKYRKKKTMAWGIRTTIAVILYVVFWKYDWVRWTLVLYIPLNLFGLLSIYGWNILLNKKIEKTNRKIIEAEEAIKESEKE